MLTVCSTCSNNRFPCSPDVPPDVPPQPVDMVVVSSLFFKDMPVMSPIRSTFPEGLVRTEGAHRGWLTKEGRVGRREGRVSI